MKKNEQSLRDLWDIIKNTNIHNNRNLQRWGWVGDGQQEKRARKCI